MNSIPSSAHSFRDPVSQFQNLSKRVSKTARKPKVKMHEKPHMSPREEVYKSMIREIRKGDDAQMNSLVHKASGILRLSHYKDLNKGRKVAVSWDIDGRRVLTYEDRSGKEQSTLQRQTSYNRKTSKSLLTSLNDPIFGLDSNNLKTLSEYAQTNNKRIISQTNGATDGELPTKIVSKVWEDYIDTGDVSKLWQSKEGILTMTPSAVSRNQSSASSITGNRSFIPDGDERPPWKTVYRKPSFNFNDISSRNSIHSLSLSSLPSLASSNRINDKHKGSPSQNSRTQSASTLQENEKVDRIQHICVVNGSVVAFKNFGFENFTNWFGDESTLEANQQRSHQPKIHKELDLTNVKSRDIKIRLFDGCKLEVEAKRHVPGTTKPIRKKEIFTIPGGYTVEDLLMCRTKAGKLVVEEITPEHVPSKANHFKKSKHSKRKTKWKLPGK